MNSLSSIFEKQSYLIKKIIDYHKSSDKKKIYINSISYFCSFAETPGYALQVFWLDKIKGISLLFKTFLKEIISMKNYLSCRLINKKSLNKRYKKIVITWASEKNFTKSKYIDSYFNIDSAKLKNSLWIVIFGGKDIPKKIPKNVILIYFEKKILNYPKLFLEIINNIIKNFLRPNTLINNFSGSHYLSLRVNSIIDEVLHNNIKLVIMPYEAQPFQSLAIRTIKNFSKQIIIKGYLHSYPAFASHIIKKKDSPNYLIVNSQDQKENLIRNLNWKKKDVIIKKSSRFIKNKKDKIEPGFIYFPIDIKSIDNVIKNIEILFSKLKNVNPYSLKIKTHPIGRKLRNNKLLEKKLKKILNNDKNSKNVNKINFSIFIGGTGAIIEALERNIDVYHITEDPVFDSFTSYLWPNIINKKIGNNLYNYKLKFKNKTLLFGNNKQKNLEYFN